MSDERAIEQANIETPNAGPRPGGGAKGGNAPQPGDPTSPAKAEARAAATNHAMKEAGFGDHKGEDLGSDGTKNDTNEASPENAARRPDIGRADELPPGTSSL